MADNRTELLERIAKLKRQRRAVVLAHYYTSAEVQAAADFLGDSLALAVEARKSDAEVLLFAGVHFMAETAKVLCPDKRVLIPCPEAGCSLADSCDAREFAAFKARYPDHTVVSYVNTTVGVKALTDICCTSSNALRVVASIPRERPVLFGPDRNLGEYVRRMTGRDNMVIWEGGCHVHEEISAEGLRSLRREHPGARTVAHPECRAEVAAEADFVGSTAAMLDYCMGEEASEFIVATETGILTEMRRRAPRKRFIPAPTAGGGCAECRYMKMVTLEKIVRTLERMEPEVVIDEEVRRRAEGAIARMIEIR